MPHVLFVCVANRARSALAELSARALLQAHPGGDGITVGSAGTQAQEGQRVWGPAMLAARTAGLNPSRFRSRVLTPERFAEADLVLTATRELRDEVATAYATAPGKVLTMRELERVFEHLVPDWGGMAYEARPAAVPGFVAHYRPHLPPIMGEELDIRDLAGQTPDVMVQSARQVFAATELLVQALCLTQPAQARVSA